MAFELKVEKFCDGCGYFDADVMRFKHCKNIKDVDCDHIRKYTDTYISCKHMAHCKKMHGELESHKMTEEDMRVALEKLSEKFDKMVADTEKKIQDQMLDIVIEGQSLNEPVGKEFNWDKEDSENG